MVTDGGRLGWTNGNGPRRSTTPTSPTNCSGEIPIREAGVTEDRSGRPERPETPVEYLQVPDRASGDRSSNHQPQSLPPERTRPQAVSGNCNGVNTPSPGVRMGFDGDNALTAMLWVSEIERRALGEMFERRFGSAVAGQHTAAAVGVGTIARQAGCDRGDVDDRAGCPRRSCRGTPAASVRRRRKPRCRSAGEMRATAGAEERRPARFGGRGSGLWAALARGGGGVRPRASAAGRER